MKLRIFLAFIITTGLYLSLRYINYVPPEFARGNNANVIISEFVALLYLIIPGTICTVALSVWFNGDFATKFKKASIFGFPLPLFSFLLGQSEKLIKYFSQVN